MKRIAAAIIALITAAFTITALAAPGDAVLGYDRNGNYDIYYNGCFAIGDTLYMVNGISISTWRVGDAEAVDYTVAFPTKEGEEDVSWSCWPFAANERIYALAFVTRYAGCTEFLRATLYEVKLTNDADVGNVARLTEKTALNWEGMISRYGQDTCATEPQCCVGMGNLCCMLIYDDVSDLQLKLLNVDTGEITTAEGFSDVSAVTPYKDGTLLVEQFSYSDAENVSLSAYDPREGSSRQVARIKVDNKASLPGLAYSAASDTLYCIKGGEIHSIDLEKGELGPAIADAPVQYINDSGGCILSESFYCHASYGAFVRNLDPAQRTEIRIRVYDNSYNDSVQKAAFTLPDTHGEISVALDRDYIVGQRLSEDMMNRNDSVDVYVLSCSDQAFSTACSRGYMAQLDSSEKLTAFGQRMYPAIRAALSRDGRLTAIPIDCNASSFGVNEKALERLGLKMEDVPRNWPDMLDFIIRLAERVKPEDKINLFYANQSFEEAKRTLFKQLFQDYQEYANHADPVAGFDTKLLRELLNKLEAIDFTRFGCKHDVGDDWSAIRQPEGDSYESDDSLSLFETDTGCSFGSFHSNFSPILLSMDGTTPPCMAMNMSVAFINPRSKHPNEAMLFMEHLADCVSTETLYCVDPSLNEPVRNSRYGETMLEYRESLEKLKAACEGAEGAEKQGLEAQIRELEELIAEYSRARWDISQANINWFRANDKNIVLQSVKRIFSNNAGDFGELNYSKKLVQPFVENDERQKRFITNASHELKTPLAVISANTEMTEVLGGKSKWTQSTRRQITRLQALIEDLVVLARLDEMKEADRSDVDLSAIVAETAEPFRSVAESAGKQFRTEVAAGVHVDGDRRGIQQVVSILLDNAVKYCDEGGAIAVRLEARPRGRGARFVVSNTYEAGRDVDTSRFFERFYRQDESHNSEKTGFGIGLSMAKEIVDRMKGRLKVDHKDGVISFTMDI